jgi:hypothetical protein
VICVEPTGTIDVTVPLASTETWSGCDDVNVNVATMGAFVASNACACSVAV